MSEPMQTLWEAHDAGRALDVSTARIRQLVSEGVLIAAARTPRGIHLFDAKTVEALRRQRAARSTRPRPASNGGA